MHMPPGKLGWRKGPMQEVHIQKRLSELADFLLSHKHEIINRYFEEVKLSPDINPEEDLSYRELVDHLPKIIDDLADTLRKEFDDGVKANAAAAGAAHGQQRWRQGFKVDDLMGELGVLQRDILVDYLAIFAQQNPGFSGEAETSARRIIHTFLSHLTVESVRQYVEESDRSLRRAKEQLELVNESRLVLLRTVSHELRNLLNAMTAPAQLLERALDETTRRKMLSMLRRHAVDMEALIEQLLDYSVFLAGRKQLKLQSFELEPLFNELVFIFEPMAEAKGLKFVAKFDSALAVVFSDRLKIKQIASNLLSNATKYTNTGQVSLYFRSVDFEHWAIVVEDTGVGIPAQELTRVFEEFHRVGPKAEISGTGLGLAITRSLVELLDGSINVDSKVGKGSRFEIVLPMKQTSSN